MALLLAMFQKLRLVREKNQLVLEQTKFSSKLSRVQKTIEKTQKRYTSLFQQIDSQAKMMQSQAQICFQNSVGLGMNGANLAYGGLTGFILNIAQGLCQQGYTNSKDSSKSIPGMSQDEFQNLYTIYSQNGGMIPYEKDDNGQPVKDDAGKYKYIDGIDASKVQLFNMAIENGRQQQCQAQMWIQNMNQNYGTQVSIWAEAKKAQLEAEQDAVLEPLNYEQTMLELEKDQRDIRLKRIEAEIQTYDQLVNQEAQNSAPKFGLG